MKFTKNVLKNGLRVITAPMPQVESIMVLLMVGVGSRYESRDVNGVAHFAEHMFFKGTKHRPTTLEISSELDSIGGVFNAFTDKEYTGYFVKCAHYNKDIAFDVLTDMILNSKFSPQEIEREKGVILEEMKMYWDSPREYLGSLYEEVLYGDHPLGWDTIGTKEAIAGLKRDNFMDYLSRFYHPNNMVLSVAGKIDEREIEDIADRFLGELPSGEVPPYTKFRSSQSTPQVLTHTKKTDQAHIALGFRAYPTSHPDRYVLSVLSGVLGAGMSSRLFIEVRERRGLAYYVTSSPVPRLDVGSFGIFAGLRLESVEEGVSVILSEVNKLKKEWVSDKELKKAKEMIKGRLVLGMEDPEGAATFLGRSELLEGKPKDIKEVLEAIDKVEAKDVKRVAEDIFVEKHLNLAAIGPFDDKDRFLNLVTPGVDR